MASVRVRWIDSLSAAATGTKVYRNDVEIADIANGVQEYIDTAAPDDATPKYEVQAHDGAGDETTQEVEGTNMDYIITSPVSSDIYPEGNAASKTGEADVIPPYDTPLVGGWLGFQSTSATSTDADNSTWSITAEMTTTAGRLQYHPVWVIGNVYRITFDAKAGSDEGQLMHSWAGVTGGPDSVPLTTSYVTYSYDLTATQEIPILRWYGAAVGAYVFVDQVSVEDITP